MGSLFLQPNPRPVNTVWGSLWHCMGQKYSDRIRDSGAPAFWNSCPVTATTGELSDSWKAHTHSIMSYLSRHEQRTFPTVTWVGVKEVLDMSTGIIYQCHRWQSRFLVVVLITSIMHRLRATGWNGDFKKQTLRPPGHVWESLPALACPREWKHRKVFPASLSKSLGPLASFPQNGGYQINYVWLCPLFLPFDYSGVRESKERTRKAFTISGRSGGLSL